MPTFEETLEGKAKESSCISLDELGDTIKGTISKYEYKADARTNQALFLTIKTAEGNVIQKYGRSLYQTLLTKVKACGGIEKLQETEHVWKQEKAGRATFNRYYPVPNNPTSTKKEK
jgi:hypothetical protein